MSYWWGLKDRCRHEGTTTNKLRLFGVITSNGCRGLRSLLSHEYFPSSLRVATTIKLPIE
jgi:hypothetical protein